MKISLPRLLEFLRSAFQLQSTTGQFYGEFRWVRGARTIESSRFMERAMGIEPTSEAYCHGRGREFESRRPRHSFQKSCPNFSETKKGAKGCNFAPFLHPFSSIRTVFTSSAFTGLTTLTRVRFRSEDERKDRCLRGMLCWRDCLRVNIQRGP